MSQRIRYGAPSPDGTQQSVKMFTHESNGARYKVFLKPQEFKWLIVNDLTELVEASGTQKDTRKMKREIKAAFVALGINFGAEERKKRVVKEKAA